MRKNVMKTLLLLCLALVAGGISIGQQLPIPSPADVGMDKALTKQISAVLRNCQTIKPGMTRSDLLKMFTTEGGLSTARHRTFVYRGCPYIKVDVDFRLSDPKQNVLEEKPTDIIAGISKPYLEWSVMD
jgi:hypothetical protein